MEWFRVEDKLPDTYERVLLYTKDRDIEIGVLEDIGYSCYKWMMYGYSTIASDCETEYYDVVGSYITHWSYLPEGPEKE